MAFIPQQLSKLMRLIPEPLRNLIQGPDSPAAADDSAGVDAAAQPGGDARPGDQALEQQGNPTTQVVFLPRDHQWGYCFWTISASDQARAQAAAAGSLCLRLADVTGLVNPQAQPHALREVVVSGDAREWFMPVPLAGRDYRVELGYRLNGGGWLSLAVSAVARMPVFAASESTAQQFEPFSLDIASFESAANFPDVQTSSGGVMHEQFYRQAIGGTQPKSRGSEAFHESNFSSPDSSTSELTASAAGGWASGLNESGAGGVPRQRSFWLVGDAELIVYGATDPSATLTIGGQVVPLNSDGTFRLQVPFRDGQQLYPILAVAADGEQKRSICLEFIRATPHAQVNTKAEAVNHWF